MNWKERANMRSPGVRPGRKSIPLNAMYSVSYDTARTGHYIPHSYKHESFSNPTGRFIMGTHILMDEGITCFAFDIDDSGMATPFDIREAIELYLYVTKSTRSSCQLAGTLFPPFGLPELYYIPTYAVFYPILNQWSVPRFDGTNWSPAPPAWGAQPMDTYIQQGNSHINPGSGLIDSYLAATQCGSAEMVLSPLPAGFAAQSYELNRFADLSLYPFAGVAALPDPVFQDPFSKILRVPLRWGAGSAIPAQIYGISMYVLTIWDIYQQMLSFVPTGLGTLVTEPPFLLSNNIIPVSGVPYLSSIAHAEWHCTVSASYWLNWTGSVPGTADMPWEYSDLPLIPGALGQVEDWQRMQSAIPEPNELRYLKLSGY